MRGISADRNHDDARHIERGKRLQRLGLQPRLSVGGQHEGQVAEFGRLRFDAAAQAGIERVERTGQDQAEDLGAPAVEIDRKEIGPEARLLQADLDLLAQLGAHGIRVLEVFGDCRPRQAHRLGEFLHRPDLLDLHRCLPFPLWEFHSPPRMQRCHSFAWRSTVLARGNENFCAHKHGRS